MCIFSYDGTDRIRFTGQGKTEPYLSRCVRPPEDEIVLRFEKIIAFFAEKSSHGQRKFLATQNVKMQMVHSLTGIAAAVGNYPVAVC